MRQSSCRNRVAGKGHTGIVFVLNGAVGMIYVLSLPARHEDAGSCVTSGNVRTSWAFQHGMAKDVEPSSVLIKML